jgi:ABC-type antimicrobial peptide transport system permease subunit
MEALPLDRSPAVHNQYYVSLLQAIRRIPGMTSAGVVDSFALGTGTTFTSVVVGTKSEGTTIVEVLPGYFETIGATLKAGRLLTDADYASETHVAIISDTAARKWFGGIAVGRELIRAGTDRTPWTVIGVINDLRHGGPLQLTTRSEPDAQVFFPLSISEYDLNTAMTVVMRPSGSMRGLPDQLRRVAQGLGPRVLVERIRTGEELFGDRVLTPRRRTVLLGLLGGLGLALALVGVFGMTAYSVTRRTAEIGVRLAFGAEPRQVVRTMLRDAAVPIGIGTVLGVGGALLATRVIESFLFSTTPTDPVTLASVAVILCVTGCLAALVPAMRAAKVDPASSLRAE